MSKNKIYVNYISGLENYYAGNYEQAAKLFAEFLKPYLSKKAYLNENTGAIYDHKELLLNSVYHIGLSYLKASESDISEDFKTSRYSKAAGIFQYCAAFAKAYKLQDFQEFLTKSYPEEFKESKDSQLNENLVKLKGYQLSELFLDHSYQVEKNFLLNLQRSKAKADIKRYSLYIEDLLLLGSGYIVEKDIVRIQEENKNLKDKLKNMRKTTKGKLAAIKTNEKDIAKDVENIYIDTLARNVDNLYKECDTFFAVEKIKDSNEIGIIPKSILECIDKLAKDVKNLFMDKLAKDIENLSKECTAFFLGDKDSNKTGFIPELINECINELGKIPEGCKYTIIGLGSIAGGKMTPWSDFEFAILINEDKDEFKQYFRDLTELLRIKVINLGETPLRSVGVELLNNFKTGKPEDDWFWDEVITEIGFRLDGPDWYACKSPLGRKGYENIAKPSYELILTPEQMLEFQNNDKINSFLEEGKEIKKSWFESDEYLVQALKRVSFIAGDKELLKKYKEKYKEKVKDTSANNSIGNIMRERELEILLKDVDNFLLKLGYEEEGKFIDVKKDIFRISDRIIDALANYWSAELDENVSINTPAAWNTIDEMQNKNILSKNGVKHLKEALSIATWLRFATYSHYKGQKEGCFAGMQQAATSSDAVEKVSNESELKSSNEGQELKKFFYIEDPYILCHFYYVMLEVQKIAKMFNDNPEEAIKKLQESNLLDDRDYTKGMVYARFLKYNDAIDCLEKARSNDEFLEYSRAVKYLKNVKDEKTPLGYNKAIEYLKDAADKTKSLEYRRAIEYLENMNKTGSLKNDIIEFLEEITKKNCSDENLLSCMCTLSSSYAKVGNAEKATNLMDDIETLNEKEFINHKLKSLILTDAYISLSTAYFKKNLHNESRKYSNIANTHLNEGSEGIKDVSYTASIDSLKSRLDRISVRNKAIEESDSVSQKSNTDVLSNEKYDDKNMELDPPLCTSQMPTIGSQQSTDNDQY